MVSICYFKLIRNFVADLKWVLITSLQVKSRKWFCRNTWRKRTRSWCHWLDSNRWVRACAVNAPSRLWHCPFTRFCSVCRCAGFCQIKDILKGALRFNQSQLEAEENEEITIADDHYTSTAAAETALSAINHHQQQGVSRRSQDSNMDSCVSTEEKEEEEQAMTPPEQQVI